MRCAKQPRLCQRVPMTGLVSAKAVGEPPMRRQRPPQGLGPLRQRCSARQPELLPLLAPKTARQGASGGCRPHRAASRVPHYPGEGTAEKWRIWDAHPAPVDKGDS